MIRHPVLIAVSMLSACAAQQASVTKDHEQAIRDFVMVRELAESDKIRTRSDNSWQELEAHFIIYKTRRETFLVEFGRACRELDDLRVVPDVRRDSNAIYARFDTIRGCRIHKIYALTEDELAELEALGESPGSRN